MLQFVVGRAVLQFLKCAGLDQLLGRPNKSSPGSPGKGAAHAYAPRTQLTCVVHGEAAGTTDQDVDRFRRDGLDNRSDVIVFFESRCIQTICSGLGIGDKSPDHLIKIFALD